MADRAPTPSTRGEFLFESLYVGVLGGSAVALFFLVADLFDGRPFFTPSLIGSVLFGGVAAEDVAKVHLDAVAYFSIVHIAAFTGLGAAICFLVREVELRSRNPVLVLLVLFAVHRGGVLRGGSTGDARRDRALGNGPGRRREPAGSRDDGALLHALPPRGGLG